MYHCCDFRHNDIWYLYDTDDFFKFNFKTGKDELRRAGFYNRKLHVGVCPDCKKDVAILYQTRKSDDKVFIDSQEAQKALNLMKLLENQINYTESDSRIIKNKPYGLCYCENLMTKVNRVDFYGQRETVLIKI